MILAVGGFGAVPRGHGPVIDCVVLVADGDPVRLFQWASPSADVECVFCVEGSPCMVRHCCEQVVPDLELAGAFMPFLHTGCKGPTPPIITCRCPTAWTYFRCRGWPSGHLQSSPDSSITPSQLSEEVMGLIKRMMALDPQARPGPQEVEGTCRCLFQALHSP